MLVTEKLKALIGGASRTKLLFNEIHLIWMIKSLPRVLKVLPEARLLSAGTRKLSSLDQI
jgi:hypothetical protein